MVGFAQVLGKEDAEAIQAYVIKRAHDLLAEQQAAGQPGEKGSGG
jgi:hypothetical protein